MVQLFYKVFRSLEGKEIVVELKNDFAVRGTLHSVDQFLNFKLVGVSAVDAVKYPQLNSLKSTFIRGSVVRYVHLPGDAIDTVSLQDASRATAAAAK